MKYNFIKLLMMSSIFTFAIFLSAFADTSTEVVMGEAPTSNTASHISKEAPQADNTVNAASVQTLAAYSSVKASDGKTYKKTQNLGAFRVVSYCDSTPEKPRYTAGGTIPKANHTISTDWSILPKGTKIMIGESDIVYTVEDTGVKGKIIDIFQSTLAEARAYGEKKFDIYIVEETDGTLVPPKQ